MLSSRRRNRQRVARDEGGSKSADSIRSTSVRSVRFPLPAELSTLRKAEKSPREVTKVLVLADFSSRQRNGSLLNRHKRRQTVQYLVHEHANLVDDGELRANSAIDSC
jgi:hypothetical protein